MNKITVALIEDHDLTRIGLRTMLKQEPLVEVIAEAKDGNAGLKIIQQTHPQVAIVDVGLPGMTGIELTQQLKQAQETGEAPETKVLIMTMQDSEETVMAAFAAGADSYCMKDASSEQLLRALEVTAAGGNWIDPTIARIVLHQSQSAYQAAHAKPSQSVISIRALDSEDVLLVEGLSQREQEVLSLIVEGCSNEEIANRCFITVGTVKTHVRSILQKLCVSDRTQAAVRALRTGLVS